MESKEKIINSISGYLGILFIFALIGTTIYGFGQLSNIASGADITFPFIIPILLILFIAKGFFFVYPNESVVMTLFGKYIGTVKNNGFFWTNPFYARRKISLRARNFETERVKVNDKMGNPILISSILVWRVQDTFQAAFEVDDYEQFVKIQSDAAVRILASKYPYDNFDDEMIEVTLRSGLDQVNDDLEGELTERLQLAGLEVLEARIGYLAYAPEIASAMLKRQQAEAIVAARFKIVEGAVGMVESALQQLSEKNIIELDEEKKATMVNNLMVVLCSDKEATPVLNSGTLHT